MHWDVKRVSAVADYKLYVELVNGHKGIFDVKPYLDRPALRVLRDERYFAQVGIQLGAVTWPDGQDIAPDTLVAELIETETTP
ncbi:MAG: DUF2442 domain-containing protein [Burkholderiales bacterium]